jgi:hypothetical protein
MAVPMPSRGQNSAPIFDKAKPRELSRYFSDLEVLLTKALITIDKEMKEMVVYYVDFETEQIWKTFPEFTTATATYKNFKDAILIHYPDATGDYNYSIRDMDMLTGERQRLGIQST